MIYRTLHRKLKIEEHEPTKTEVEGQKIFYIINLTLTNLIFYIYIYIGNIVCFLGLIH